MKSIPGNAKDLQPANAGWLMTRIIKVLSVSLLLAALVSMIASCASQETYERVTNEDCLVLIPTEIVRITSSISATVRRDAKSAESRAI